MRRNLIAELFNEHVRFPGFPSIIVMRGFVYDFLRDCGWNPSERGIGSMEYIAMAGKVVEEELTDSELRDTLLSQVREHYVSVAV